MQELDVAAVGDLMRDGTITGGMIPKLNTAIDAIKAGEGTQCPYYRCIMAAAFCPTVTTDTKYHMY